MAKKVAVIGYGAAFNMGRHHLREMERAGMIPTAVCDLDKERLKAARQDFPGIKTYMEETKKFARENGYVETVFGRRCHFPRITSPNASERAFMERAAINAPIQGAAADIIRRAMIRMQEALDAAKLSAKMLLQDHDELLFEVETDAAPALIAAARATMEGAAHPAVDLKVPLIVEAGQGPNWAAAH